MSCDFRVSTRESMLKQSITNRQLEGGAVVVFLWRKILVMLETLLQAVAILECVQEEKAEA